MENLNTKKENKVRLGAIIVLFSISSFSVGLYQSFLFFIGAVLAGLVALGVLKLIEKLL